MADTFTTNLVLTLPEIGSSESTWGTKLNTNLTTIDGLFGTGPALKIASGGTGAITATDARANLGLGTLATQNASAVVITGGTATLSSATIANTTPLFNMMDSAGGTDQKQYQFRVTGGTLSLLAINDTGGASSTAFQVARAGGTITAITFYAQPYYAGYAVYHQNNISSAPISEAQITDGSTFPRLASAETITGQWNFTTVPAKTSGGKFLHYASTSYVGGAVTVSTSDPSGTPATGDRWVKYVP